MSSPATATPELSPLRLSSVSADFDARLSERLRWSDATDLAVQSSVTEILTAVEARGDAAVLEYTRRFDGLAVSDMSELEMTPAQLRAAYESLPHEQRRALEQAAARIRAFHQAQLQALGRGFSYRDEDGTLLGQKVTPLDRVGIYVPGGKAAYPSSVLMNAIPAQVAGVGEIIMVVPTPRGERNPLVLAAAHLAGVTRAFAIGGAQAVGALAYGTAAVPQVDKITGPGNAYVAAAKRHVFGRVGIDMIAGPSEILVLADASTPADWVAMDLFSQAEHDELAQSIVLCPDAAFLDAVEDAMNRLLIDLPRADIIAKSINGRGALIQTRSMEEACVISNRIAPEHLEVSSAQPHRWEPLLRHAGAIFLGAYTSEALGDYSAGPNHVLPTSGTARFSSPLGVYDFQKRSSLIEVSARGAQTLGQIASILARGEGLHAHARAAELRLEALAQAESPLGKPLPDGATARVERLLRQDVQGLHGYAVQPSAGMVKVDTMENPFRLPEALRAELGARLGEAPLNRYPAEPVEALRAALERHAQMPEGCALMLGNGSDELIGLLTLALDRPGNCILAPLPGFVMYELSARFQGVPFVGVPTTKDFELDGPAMLAAVRAHQPALVWLAYPNNPTANLWDAEVIEAIIEAAPGLVVMDEAYQPFASRDSMPSMRRHEHVMVMRTMSKFGLAGARIGYLMGHRAIVAQIEKLRPPFNISVLNAEAGLFALAHEAEYQRQAQCIRKERDRLSQALQALPDVRAYPSEANMILVRVPQAAQVFAGMKARGVLIKNVSGLHPLLAECLRITVGTPEENVQTLAALAAALQELRP